MKLNNEKNHFLEVPQLHHISLISVTKIADVQPNNTITLGQRDMYLFSGVEKETSQKRNWQFTSVVVNAVF